MDAPLASSCSYRVQIKLVWSSFTPTLSAETRWQASRRIRHGNNRWPKRDGWQSDLSLNLEHALEHSVSYSGVYLEHPRLTSTMTVPVPAPAPAPAHPDCQSARNTVVPPITIACRLLQGSDVTIMDESKMTGQGGSSVKRWLMPKALRDCSLVVSCRPVSPTTPSPTWMDALASCIATGSCGLKYSLL